MSDDGYPEVGERLGSYSVGARIGTGGMGWVFEALDTRLNRQVALKVIAPQLAGDEGFRERFVREAQAQASLDSPHVVHVYEHGDVDGRLYLVTQHVPDGDLAGQLRAHGAPPREAAVDIVAQVAAGLADVHAAGFVHRDVKPSNVLLRRRESGVTAYLGDFGIVREAGADHTATAAGTAGTPGFMAPELHSGAKAGPRTDVYSLGCLLWTTLTGSPPYDGSSEWEVVTAHRERPVPQLPDDGSLAEGINGVLRRAMAKDPAERYADAAPMRDDLRALLALPAEGHVVPVEAVDPPVAAPLPPPRNARLKIAAVVVALLVLAAAAVAVWALTWGDDDDPASSAPSAGAGAGPADPVGRGAVASIATALLEQGEVTPAVASCAAETWVEQAGVDRLRAEGYLDEQLAYVDRPASEVSADMRSAIATAVAACGGTTAD
ncbi:serine/threonine-protein kinase [Nocardioides sp. Arc9.136]|uniref:serine/threonine-protein kinase n=1 Tax=Nocardioides sp. Arc9.136 TaxID=2996826 RepID=UPI00266693D6|nr:serine/threonine-protein kinase [Nocardioides sp. Arc9.136]WKN48332.1 serine/threonine-protein kinase [Nocardioides sp. Arc9.136]